MPDPSAETHQPLHSTREIHFSQGGHASQFVPPFAVMAPLLIFFLLIVLPVTLLSLMGQLWWMPLAIRLALVSALVVAGLWLLFKQFARAYRRGTAIGGLAFATDPEARINVICWHDQAAQLQQIGDIAFEPEQFRLYQPEPFLPRSIMHKLSPRWQEHMRRRAPADPFIVCYLGAIIRDGQYVPYMLVLALVLVLWSMRIVTIVRVVPGGFDFLRYPVLARPDVQPEIERIDLRQSHLILDFRVHALTIDSQAERPRRIGLALMPQREQAMRTLLMAALSTTTPAPISD